MRNFKFSEFELEHKCDLFILMFLYSQQSAGMDVVDASSTCTLQPSASGLLATSASFTSRDTDKNQAMAGDEFISSCGILSVVDSQPQVNVSNFHLSCDFCFCNDYLALDL